MTGPGDDEDDALTLTWRLDLVDAVDVHGGDGVAPLARLLASPAGRSVRTVAFRSWDDPAELLAVLARVQPSPLCALELGEWSPMHEPGEGEAALGDLSGLWAAHPQLESLALTGEVRSFGAIEARGLRRFSWETLCPAPACLAAVAAARWPRLDTLALHFARGDGSFSAWMPPIRHILDGAELPALRHLTLYKYALPRELWSELPRAKVLPRLATLALGKFPHYFRDEHRELRRMREHPAFAHLERFEI
jgi:hypothetical protein